MKRTVDEIKSIKILKARNGIALVAVLSILLILTLLLPVMFSMSEVATKDSVTGKNRQRVIYLARSGVEMGVAYIKQIVVEYNDVVKAIGKELDGSVDLDKTNAAGQKVFDLAFTDTADRKQKREFTEFIETIKTNGSTEKDSDFGIERDANGTGTVNMENVWYYLGREVSDPGNYANYTTLSEDVDYPYYKYISSESGSGQSFCEGDVVYTLVGHVEITISFDGAAHYYVSDDEVTINGTTYKKGTELKEEYCLEENVSRGYSEIKNGITKVQNNNYIVKATAFLGTYKKSMSAVMVETKELGNTGDNIVQYTGNEYSESPDFYLEMNDLHRNTIAGVTEIYDAKHVLVLGSKSTDNGGNLCLPNPQLANFKYQIQYQNDYYAESVGGYVNQNVYGYTTVGDMHIKCEGVGSENQALVLGAYPGIRWKKANKPSSNTLVTVNYNTYSNSVQNANFIAYCATRTLQLDMGIDVRVNPARAGRLGDVKISLTSNSNNASLFKAIALQGKDIIINGQVDMMFSFFNPQNKNYYTSSQERNTGKRMGTVVLSAPSNSPYSYYNVDRNETVPAGMVYFGSDVYLWLISYNNDGSSSGYTKLTETVYETKPINSNSFSRSTKTSDGKTVIIEKANAGDFEVYRLFKAGDVYYFNSNVVQKDKNNKDTNVGMNLTNWFIETRYLKTNTATGVVSFFNNFRQNLYSSIIKNFTDQCYVDDDMHYIGNIATSENLVPPSVENQVYVVWS